MGLCSASLRLASRSRVRRTIGAARRRQVRAARDTPGARHVPQSRSNPSVRCWAQALLGAELCACPGDCYRGRQRWRGKWLRSLLLPPPPQQPDRPRGLPAAHCCTPPYTPLLQCGGTLDQSTLDLEHPVGEGCQVLPLGVGRVEGVVRRRAALAQERDLGRVVLGGGGGEWAGRARARQKPRAWQGKRACARSCLTSARAPGAPP